MLLASTIIMIVGAAMCAVAENYDFHLWSRCLLGLAAGQSEALVPMITQVRLIKPLVLLLLGLLNHDLVADRGYRKYSSCTSAVRAS